MKLVSFFPSKKYPLHYTIKFEVEVVYTDYSDNSTRVETQVIYRTFESKMASAEQVKFLNSLKGSDVEITEIYNDQVKSTFVLDIKVVKALI